MALLGDRMVQLLVAGVLMALGAWLAMLVRADRPGRGRMISVVGLGGGGANAVDAMIRAGAKGVDYVAIDSDTRALRRSAAKLKIAIGQATIGLGAGGDPSGGETAARDAAEEIGRALDGSELVVIVAGLGGGTGSGAAPVVAEIARQQGALTIAVVTKPFRFEGARRRDVAEGAAEMLGRADAVATIPNDRVRDLVPADVTVEDAFQAIDELLHRSVGEIVDLFAVPGRISLDFADVRRVLRAGGTAVMGLGRAGGENRAVEAARRAIAATLLESGLEGATSIVLNVTGSRKLRLAELDAVSAEVLAASNPDANIVFGMTLDRRLREEVQVALIATGLDAERTREAGSSARAGATPRPADWRPVWLRDRSAPEPQAPEPEYVEAPSPRRQKGAARRARVGSDAT